MFDGHHLELTWLLSINEALHYGAVKTLDRSWNSAIVVFTLLIFLLVKSKIFFNTIACFKLFSSGWTLAHLTLCMILCILIYIFHKHQCFITILLSVMWNYIKKQILFNLHWGNSSWIWYPNRYMVTFSPLPDSKEEPQAIIIWDLRTGIKKRGFHCEKDSVWPTFRCVWIQCFCVKHTWFLKEVLLK